MVVADLHVHTTNSDGELSLEDVLAAARRAGLDAIAITDHDRPHPELSAPIAEIDGVTVVHGIELRVEVETGTTVGGGPDRQGAGADGSVRVDLLGYGLDATPALREECERIQRDRAERGARIVDRLESRLDVDLDVESRPGLGRPHIARAVAAHPDLEFDVQGVFDELVGDDGPCYVPRNVPSFERGRALLEDACTLVGLAHPLRCDDPAAALALTSELDAVERWYPYDRPVDPDANLDVGPVERAIDRYDLVPTGGSDAHGSELGVAGLDDGAWERVRTALPS